MWELCGKRGMQAPGGPLHLNTVETARRDVVRVAAEARALDQRASGHG